LPANLSLLLDHSPKFFFDFIEISSSHIEMVAFFKIGAMLPTRAAGRGGNLMFPTPIARVGGQKKGKKRGEN
jgi:hypothetical protein